MSMVKEENVIVKKEDVEVVGSCQGGEGGHGGRCDSQGGCGGSVGLGNENDQGGRRDLGRLTVMEDKQEVVGVEREVTTVEEEVEVNE